MMYIYEIIFNDPPPKKVKIVKKMKKKKNKVRIRYTVIYVVNLIRLINETSVQLIQLSPQRNWLSSNIFSYIMRQRWEKYMFRFLL